MIFTEPEAFLAEKPRRSFRPMVFTAIGIRQVAIRLRTASDAGNAPLMGVRLKDSDLRKAAHGRLLRHALACPDTLVIDELGIAHGACRVDIAIINGHIRGIELKAEADTLDRLAGQVAGYGKIVDFASLVVSECHLDHALTYLPEWWGVVLARQSVGGSIMFRRLRAERYNRQADPMTIARLLWHAEAAAVLRSRGHAEKVLRAPRTTLYEKLIEELPRRELARVVRHTLKARSGWRDRAEPS